MEFLFLFPVAMSPHVDALNSWGRRNLNVNLVTPMANQSSSPWHINCFIMEWTHLPICLHNCLVLHEWDLSQVPNVFVSMRLFSLIPQGFEWNTKPGSLALQKLLILCTHLCPNGISLCLGLCIECKLWALGDQVKGHKRNNRMCRALRPYCGELLVLWFQVF